MLAVPYQTSPPLQVALRRQQAQEEELGMCSPVSLSGSEMMVKNEVGADCLFSVEGRSPTPTSHPTSAVTGNLVLHGPRQILLCYESYYWRSPVFLVIKQKQKQCY